jgi:hypothetical protein
MRCRRTLHREMHGECKAVTHCAQVLLRLLAKGEELFQSGKIRSEEVHSDLVWMRSMLTLLHVLTRALQAATVVHEMSTRARRMRKYQSRGLKGLVWRTCPVLARLASMCEKFMVRTYLTG